MATFFLSKMIFPWKTCLSMFLFHSFHLSKVKELWNVVEQSYLICFRRDKNSYCNFAFMFELLWVQQLTLGLMVYRDTHPSWSQAVVWVNTPRKYLSRGCFLVRYIFDSIILICLLWSICISLTIYVRRQILICTA